MCVCLCVNEWIFTLDWQVSPYKSLTVTVDWIAFTSIQIPDRTRHPSPPVESLFQTCTRTLSATYTFRLSRLGAFCIIQRGGGEREAAARTAVARVLQATRILLSSRARRPPPLDKYLDSAVEISGTVNAAVRQTVIERHAENRRAQSLIRRHRHYRVFKYNITFRYTHAQAYTRNINITPQWFYIGVGLVSLSQ